LPFATKIAISLFLNGKLLLQNISTQYSMLYLRDILVSYKILITDVFNNDVYAHTFT